MENSTIFWETNGVEIYTSLFVYYKKSCFMQKSRQKIHTDGIRKQNVEKPLCVESTKFSLKSQYYN